MDLQGSEQLHGSVALVVVSAPLDLAGAEREHRLGPVERLDLGFLIYAQHDRVLRRIEVQSDHVDHLGDEVGIGRAREGTEAMRLQPVLTEDLVHGVPSDAGCLGQGPHAPMGLARWLLVADGLHHAQSVGFRVHPGPARAGLIGQSRQPIADEPLAPLDDHPP